MDPLHCTGCQVSDQDRRLHKCPICFRLACDECGHHAYGRVFCTPRCAQEFFFGEDDE